MFIWWGEGVIANGSGFMIEKLVNEPHVLEESASASVINTL